MRGKCWRGSVSIFFCLVLAGVFLLQATLADAAFLAFQRRTRAYALEHATQAVLAGFDTALMEDYGLYGKQVANQEDLVPEFEAYFLRSALSLDSWREDGVLSFPGRNCRNVLSVEISQALSSPEVLKKQIVHQMRYRSGSNLLQWILEQLDLLSFGEEMSVCYQKYAEAAELQQEAAAALVSCQKIVEGVYTGDYACVNGFLHSPLQELERQALKEAGLLLAKWQEGEEKRFLESSAYLQARSEFLRALHAIQFDLKTYRDYNLQAHTHLQNLVALRERILDQLTALDAWRESYVPSSEWETKQLEAFHSQCDTLRRQAAVMSQPALLAQLEGNLRSLQQALDCGNEVEECLSQYEDAAIPFDSLSSALEGFTSISYAGPLRVARPGEAGNSDYLAQDPREESVEAAHQLPDSTSSSVIPDDQFSRFPSQTHESSSSFFPFSLDSLQSFSALKSLLDGTFSFSTLFGNALQTIEEVVLVDDYVMSLFGNRQEPITKRYAFWNSEVEYIIVGEAREEDNQNGVRNRLLGLRFLLNFLHVVSDGEKHALAEEIGFALAASLSFGIGSSAYSVLVMAAWALGEAVFDVKDLLDGKGVPLLKTSHTWKLGIAGFLSGEEETEINGEEERFALDYPSYCRLLLLTVDMETKLLRIRDMIEWNLRKGGEGRYSFDQVYTSFTVHERYYIPLTSLLTRLFLAEGRREYEMEASYGYCY